MPPGNSAPTVNNPNQAVIDLVAALRRQTEATEKLASLAARDPKQQYAYNTDYSQLARGYTPARAMRGEERIVTNATAVAEFNCPFNVQFWRIFHLGITNALSNTDSTNRPGLELSFASDDTFRDAESHFITYQTTVVPTSFTANTGFLRQIIDVQIPIRRPFLRIYPLIFAQAVAGGKALRGTGIGQFNVYSALYVNSYGE